MRGDINATELYTNREFLVRVGLGIYDVEVGTTGGVGFEDVRRFSYVEDQEQDPKLFRRKVFELVGRYYPNDLAKALWAEFRVHQAELRGQTGLNVSLEEAARRWLEQHGHEFLKAWAFRQESVPFRMRNQAEPHRGWLAVAACRVAPQWRELLEAGFSLPAILVVALLEMRAKSYLRVVARLSGHRVENLAEQHKREAEIDQLAEYLNQQAGYDIGRRAATIEYYRRLTLLAEIEGKHLNSSILWASAC